MKDELKHLFNEKYVYFIWDDILEDKKCFISNNICSLIDYVNNKDIKHYVAIKKSSNSYMPFKSKDMAYVFCYYDPHYEERWAYYNEDKKLEYYIGNENWHDVDNDCTEFLLSIDNTKLRVKEDDKYAELKKAYKEGKTIQYNLGGEWVDWENPKFDDDLCEYRIKPQELKSIDILPLKYKCWKCGKEITFNTMSSIIYPSNPPKYTCKDCEKLESDKDVKIDNTKNDNLNDIYEDNVEEIYEHNILEKVYKILKNYDKRISDLEDYCNFLK